MADDIGRISRDPDLMRHEATPQLRDSVAPEHYINLERLGGRALPDTRYAYLRLLRELNLEPMQTGFIPYAVIEGTQRLALAFAEFRDKPDEAARAKVLVHAGILGHYAQDLTQPLHTTVHHDGRALENMTSPRSGIHRRVDGLIQEASAGLEGLGAPRAYDDLFAAVLDHLEESHALVDRVYESEPGLMAMDPGEKPSDELLDLARERLRTTVLFTAGLYLTAWERSASIELPDWIREAAGASSDEAGPRSAGCYSIGVCRW
jgi:hypothetical protein